MLDSKPIRLTLLAVAVALLSLLRVTPAMALDVGISPARVEQSVEQGDTMKGRLRVYTQSETPIEARVYVMDLVIRANGGFEFLEPGESQYSASTWISLSKDTVTLAKDSPAWIEYQIAVPEDAESGGRYAMVFCEVRQGDEATVTLAGRVGCQLLLTVAGEVNQHVALGDIQAPAIMLGLGGEQIALRVVNDGNVHAIPGGYFQVTGGLLAMNRSWELSRVTLLPGAEHTFVQKLDGLPWIGRVKVRADLKYGPSATELTTGEVREIEVLVISWKILALVGLVAAGTLLSALRGQAARRKKARLRRLHGRRAPRASS